MNPSANWPEGQRGQSNTRNEKRVHMSGLIDFSGMLFTPSFRGARLAHNYALAEGQPKAVAKDAQRRAYFTLRLMSYSQRVEHGDRIARESVRAAVAAYVPENTIESLLAKAIESFNANMQKGETLPEGVTADHPDSKNVLNPHRKHG